MDNDMISFIDDEMTQCRNDDAVEAVMTMEKEEP
jgi:hypothetical protein